MNGHWLIPVASSVDFLGEKTKDNVQFAPKGDVGHHSHLFSCRGHFLLLCDFFRQNFGRRKDLNGSFILQNIPLRGAQNLFIKVIQKRCNSETKLHFTWQSNGFNTLRILSSISFNCFLLLALSTMRVFFISSSSGFSSAARIPSSWS